MDKEIEKTPEELIEDGLQQLVEPEVEESGEEENTLTGEEQKAYEMGWRPQDEYEGDHPWVGAEEFLGRKPLFDQISKSNKRVKRLEEQLQKVLDHVGTVEKAQYEKAKRDLKELRKEAMKQGDFDEFERLNEQEKELDEQAPEKAPAAPPEFTEWVEENDWYTNDPDLRQFADNIAPAMKSKHPNLSPKEFFDKVGEVVKQANPDKFGTPKRGTRRIPNGGASPSNQPQSGDKGFNTKWEKLTPEEKRMATEFARDGLMSKEEYMKQIDVDSR